MAKPKSKSSKNIDREGKKVSESKSQKIPVSDDVLHIFQESFVGFDKLSQDEKNQRYGDAEYLQQFWKYFAEQNPDLLDRVKEKDLPHYLKQLQDKGFSVKYIVQDSPRLHTKFGSQMTEMQVMQNSLGQLHAFCDESKNNFPADLFSRFASFAGFHPTKHIINVDGKLKTLDDLYPLWMNFLEKEGVSVNDTLQKNFSQILVPAYSPIERIMVEVAIQKLKKQLPPKLKTDFVSRFPLPIDIFSSYQDLISFKQEWILFLADHAAEIDKDLAKKLDDVIVTNGDISDVLASSKVKFAAAQGSLAGEKYFRQVFDKVAMHQLSEYANKNQQTVDRYLTALATTFKEFPPYINEITKIYPFDHDSVAHVDVSLDADIRSIESQIAATEEEYLAAPVDQQKRLRHKISQLQQDKEARKWQAYVIYLETKDAKLGPIFAQLVDNKFNFPVLSQADQQTLVSLLVEHKLKDVLATKMPEILDVDQESLSTFFKDLFDLSKMDIMIPTRHGNIPISFVKKEFMSSSQTQLPSIADLEGLQNLPLNFVVQVGTSSQSFFEETPIFDSLYTDFKGSNETVRINDAYKVEITKNGQTVRGYLSGYCPCDEYNDKNYDGKALYLYSQPVTSPSQERELVTWPNQPGESSSPESKIPVVIKDAEQKDCHIDIIDRQLNLNGDAIGALLFGYVLGEQTKRISLSPEKQEFLAKQLGKLNVYKDKAAPTEEEEPVAQEAEASKELSAKDKCISARKQLRGYPFSKDTKDGGFVAGSRLFVPRNDSELYPKDAGRSWMYAEIVKINDTKGTFTIKFHGGELSLGKSEGKTVEFPMKDTTFEELRTKFGDLYKTPDLSNKSMNDTMRIVKEAGLVTDMDKYFGNLQRNNNEFSFAMGEDADKKVEYFGRYEPSLGEAADQENAVKNLSLYKIKYHTNHTVTLSGEFVDGGMGVKYTRDMDYPSFLIFIKEKGLQPKTQAQAKTLKKSASQASLEAPTTKRGFSISNMIGFVKNSFSKIKDSIKKYDDERTEEFTDFMLQDGQNYSVLAKILSPFGRVSSAFETLGAEHFQERDNRVWKKVEKRKKYYEDSDFGLIYEKYIKNMLNGTLVIKPHYKAAAMLLAMIAKGKGPYNRNPEWAAKGMRVNILMGPEHQARYLDMRAKLVRELQQGSSQYGPVWIDNKKNEILELEMKYLVHVMDARQLGIQDGDKTKYYFYGKYSHTFIDELEKGYTTFFSQGNVEEIYGKVKGASFDFARSEFHRLLGDRPQQAIPFLKVMATKAMNESQWKAFEVAVMVGMLSGVFLTMTMSDTQGMIKNICRKRGFVPGVWAKNIYQRDKLIGLLNLFSHNEFGTEMKKNGVDFAKFSYDDMSGGTKKLIQRADPSKPEKDRGIFQRRVLKDDTLSNLSNFFKLTGKNVEGKTLLDLYEDPKTSAAHKEIIHEFLENSNEKHEDGDPDVGKNRSALTGSILTQNQNNIHQMMHFNGQGFAGEDGDAVQNQEAFFERMRDAIPKARLQSSIQVKFFVDKFFTWFDEKGFSTATKVELIKRLKWCQQHPNSPDVDNVLYYSICGEVYKSLGRVTIPAQFEDAMLAWKDFFKTNMATILTPTILKDSFGGVSYQQDYERYQPQLDPWENCAQLFDNTQRQIFISSLTPEQRQAVNQHYKEITRDPYINRKLYETADAVEKTCFKENRFKTRAFSSPVVSSAPTSHRKATGANIANPEVLDNLSNILQNKSPVSSRQNDDFVDMSFDPQDNYTDLD